MKDFICVIGGITMDLTATSFANIKMEDSNPGKVNWKPGGVGRNIAENLCRIGINTSIISAVGNDVYSRAVIENCQEIGIDTSNMLVFDDINCALYICVNDNDGEMCVAIAAMDIFAKISPESLTDKMKFINNARLVVLDTNLPATTINYIAKNCKAPIFADLVSVSKSVRIKDSLNNVYLLKANRLEAEAISGINIKDKSALEEAANRIIEMGVKNLIITLGAEGAYYCNETEKGYLPAMKVNIVNTTGCGDAFMAAATARYLDNVSLYEIAKYGMVCAGITATHDGPVLQYLSKDMIERHLNEIKI